MKTVIQSDSLTETMSFTQTSDRIVSELKVINPQPQFHNGHGLTYVVGLIL